MASIEWRVTGPPEAMPTTDALGQQVVLEQSVPVTWYLVSPGKDKDGNDVEVYKTIHSGGVLTNVDASSGEVERLIEERTKYIIDEYKRQQLLSTGHQELMKKRHPV